MSTISGRSSVGRGAESRPSAASVIGSAMPDGSELGAVDAAEAAAVTADGRLVTGVGRRLVLWAAGTTLLVLVGLGVALYVAVSQSLASTGVHQLDARANDLRRLIEGPTGRPPDG